MPKIRVTKSFTFDMAHALEGYDGLCKNIHGHTYTLSITLLGEIRNESGHPKNGFVLDFKEIKQLVKKEVIQLYDHCLVLNNSSEIARLNLLNSLYERVIYTDYQPTCENLLFDIKQKIDNQLPKSVELLVVRLDETPTSYAEWVKSDQ